MRLKLIAPFHRPRAPRFGFSSSLPFPLCFDLAMTALRLHQRRFTRHSRFAHLLGEVWPVALLGRFDRHPSARGDGAVDGFDDGYVDEPFDARGLGLAVGAHTLREMHQLGCELIALGELLLALLFADLELVAQAFGIFI